MYVYIYVYICIYIVCMCVCVRVCVCDFGVNMLTFNTSITYVCILTQKLF